MFIDAAGIEKCSRTAIKNIYIVIIFFDWCNEVCSCSKLSLLRIPGVINLIQKQAEWTDHSDR